MSTREKLFLFIKILRYKFSMRNLHIPSRSPIYNKNAMVATSHPEATVKALEIIKKGGNAVVFLVFGNPSPCALLLHAFC